MAVAMKGLLKGLRYISHIFEDENEPELQIGVPTDVRHVAHIGWDGPTTSPPSWMDKFKGDGEPVSPSPTQDTIQRLESVGSESPSKHRAKVSRCGESKPRRKKTKGSSKPKNAILGLDPDLEGG